MDAMGLFTRAFPERFRAPALSGPGTALADALACMLYSAQGQCNHRNQWPIP